MATRFNVWMAGLLLVAAAMILLGYQAAPDRGEVVFSTVCATCHSMDPPAKLAPPMRMVARHYQMAGLEDGWGAMRAWLDGPSLERTVLPAHAVERFGLMPPLSLSAEDADAVIAYIRAEYGKAAMPPGCRMADSTGVGCGMMRGMGQGAACAPGATPPCGMMRGMRPDSSGTRMMGRGMMRGPRGINQ